MDSTSSIKVLGYVKITAKNALTGEIREVREGDNLVLNTGLESLGKLLSGNFSFAAPVPANVLISDLVNPSKYIVQYMQFGVNNTTPKVTDMPSTENGADGSLNTLCPVFNVTYYSVDPFSVTFQGMLTPAQGNDVSGNARYYSEVVLMSLYSDNGTDKYRWFARKTFANLLKDTTTVLEVEWTITFKPEL